MDKKKFYEYASEFWGVKPSVITDGLDLDDSRLNNRSSVRFYEFVAAVEARFKVRVSNISKIRTIGDFYDNCAPKK